MTPRRENPPLARRLLGLYLLFGLTSVSSFGVILAFLFGYLLSQDHERGLVDRIDEVRALIQNDQTQNGGSGAQTLVSLLSAEDWVAYVGLVSADDEYIAHTRPSRLGQPADAHAIAKVATPVIERRTVSCEGQNRQEYWATLQLGQDRYGYLQVGVVTSNLERQTSRLSEWLPIVTVAPLSILIFGSFFLVTSTRTTSQVEGQLCALSDNSSNAECHLQPLPEANAVAVGWNRLLERLSGRRDGVPLKEKLNQSLSELHDQRLARMLNGLPDGIAATDEDGRITYANQAFCVLMRQPNDAAALRGKPIRDIFPAQSNSQNNVRPEFHDFRPSIIELKLGAALADGVLRVGRYPLQSNNGAAVRQHAWTVRDVTQQKLADEMREEFLYSATHELRTPLANIKAYAETLALDTISDIDQQKGFLNTINSEATRLARFVDELLNVSQMEAGSLSLSRQETDLERVLTEVADKVRPQMQQKQIEFQVALPPKLPKVSLDKDKFISALVNLLGNAAKYTPDGGKVAFKVNATEQELEICVEDTGIGIKAEDLPKIGTKFFRAADDRVRDIPGSGLGLAFASEVVRLHGAKLAVHSELNKGTRFTITMPLSGGR